ncbi:hypothetical protein B0T17DRAFT_595369 [Bombardia bombarda]|uniref:Uncharacterized protein n=1 Tax=Bombardia bombarda TaxID=252184 RepID=A0AA39XKM3_9PEZI|nr:hypothetical protein B0T17DRAFT_595369 [Bombardia bombarda]
MTHLLSSATGNRTRGFAVKARYVDRYTIADDESVDVILLWMRAVVDSVVNRRDRVSLDDIRVSSKKGNVCNQPNGPRLLYIGAWRLGPRAGSHVAQVPVFHLEAAALAAQSSVITGNASASLKSHPKSPIWSAAAVVAAARQAEDRPQGPTLWVGEWIAREERRWVDNHNFNIGREGGITYLIHTSQNDDASRVSRIVWQCGIILLRTGIS